MARVVGLSQRPVTWLFPTRRVQSEAPRCSVTRSHGRSHQQKPQPVLLRVVWVRLHGRRGFPRESFALRWLLLVWQPQRRADARWSVVVAQTWLVEVNSNPCLELSSPFLGLLIPRMLEHLFCLTVDKHFPPQRRQSPVSSPATTPTSRPPSGGHAPADPDVLLEEALAGVAAYAAEGGGAAGRGDVQHLALVGAAGGDDNGFERVFSYNGAGEGSGSAPAADTAGGVADHVAMGVRDAIKA